MASFMQITFLFIVYACLGWVCEVAFAALTEKRFVNRGFLNGPYCPVYGFGALMVISALTPLAHNLPALFLGSMFITSVLEYITGASLEKLFHTRWWDYSDKPLNLNGHVCLPFSAMWGAGCTLVVKIIQPFVRSAYAAMPDPLAIALVCLFITLMLIDLIATVVTVHKLSARLHLITQLADEMRKISDDLGETFIYGTVTQLEKRAVTAREWMTENVQPHLEQRAASAKEWMNENVQPHLESLDARADRGKEAIASYVGHRIDDAEALRARYHEGMEQLKRAMGHTIWERRLLSAFPKAHSIRYPQALERLRAFYAQRVRSRGKRRSGDETENEK